MSLSGKNFSHNFAPARRERSILNIPDFLLRVDPQCVKNRRRQVLRRNVTIDRERSLCIGGSMNDSPANATSRKGD